MITRLIRKFNDPKTQLGFSILFGTALLRWALEKLRSDQEQSDERIETLTSLLFDRYPGDRALALETLLERKGVLRAEEIDELLFDSLIAREAEPEPEPNEETAEGGLLHPEGETTE